MIVGDISYINFVLLVHGAIIGIYLFILAVDNILDAIDNA
jgi:hypothetical protein